MCREHAASLSSPRGFILTLLAAAVFSGTLPGDCAGATLTVNTTSDSGAGSLRQAIQTANATTAADTITFSIGTGARTIALSSALPAITNSVTIDATTQPGYAGKPLIELSGSSVASGSGLLLAGGSNTIRGLIINGFPLYGIDIEGGGTNVIVGNYIGTDSSGTAARTNAWEGIFVSGSCGNFIGGTNAADRNVISGNGDAGIYLYLSRSNVIRGNYIGTTAAGTAGLGNLSDGIDLVDAPGNVVGGTNAAARNLISANGASGLYLYDFGTVSNLVQGNYLGTDVTGTLALGNQAEGLTLASAPNNTLGGTNTGAGNVIAANSQNGIGLYGPGQSNTVVQGNLIGTTATGTAALGNGFAGVWLSAATSNCLGGLVAAARNVVSGNKQDGVSLTTGSAGNSVLGNYIGVNAAGSAALANGFNGLTLNSSVANTIGGASASARNLISANGYYGIQVLSGATANTLLGNFIGTDVTGRSALGNHLSGVRIESPANTVGGPQAGAGNLISGNGLDGIFVVGAGAGTNLIQGNWVGTTLGGTNALGNGRAGVGLSGAPANVVGGSVAGAGNVISANGNAGLYLLDRTAAGNQIQGNKIGTDPSGLLSLGNAFEGIYISNVVSTVIGGSSAAAGNVISANHYSGVYLLRAAFNSIQGNWIGTGMDGVTALNNGQAGLNPGIDCDTGSTNNLIGGAAGAGNHIAFSAAAGVRVRTGAVNNRITSNAIFSNGALGIDLGPAGVTLNDPSDADTGANNLQNFPVLSGAVGGNPTWVRGTLNSTANSSFQVQFFANPSGDSSGYGQGQLYLGDATVTTGADGNGSFLASLPVSVPVGYVITATTTDSAGNTSEFSACASVGPVPRLAVAPAANRQLSLSWTNTAAGFGLQQASSLLPPIQWTAVTNLPTVQGGQYVVTLSATNSNRFYRLSFQ